MSDPREVNAPSFANRWRPGTLARIIGHETAVTRLRGMIASGKLPSAILITGPTAAGKTTLARAFATEVNGRPVAQQTDYKEINAGTTRGIDDMRELEKISKFRPQSKRRFIVIDEVQSLLSNKAAAQSILKPLEEPSPGTTWILCSMDPTKFGSGDGRAIANRAKQFVLEPHSELELLKQAARIARGESMDYVLDERRLILKEVVRNCNGEMRTLANLMESLYDYHAGLDTKPRLLRKSDVTTVLSSTQSSDDQLAIQLLLAVYTGKYKMVVRCLLDVNEGFPFITKLLAISRFYLSNMVLDGQRHSRVWASGPAKEFMAQMNVLKIEPTLGSVALVHSTLVEIRARAATFAVGETDLLSSELYKLIKELNR